MWALIFITFVSLGNGDFSFKSTKTPNEFTTLELCEAMNTEVRDFNRDGKFTGICVKIETANTDG